MPKIKFDAMTIKNLNPKNKSVEYFDTSRNHGERSLGIRVSPKGKKTWFLLYYAEGKTKRFPLGIYPRISLKDVRAEAAKHLEGDPAKAAQQKKADDAKQVIVNDSKKTMVDLWEAYQGSLALKQKPKSLSTTAEEKRRWEKIINPQIGHLKVEDVTPTMLSGILDSVARNAPVSANRLHSFLRVMFKPALKLGWITTHPMHWIDPPGGSESARRRILSDEEIRILWPLFDEVRPNPRDILKLILLTCQRPGEIMSMRWADLDLENATWTQETNKTDVPHVVALSKPVVQIIKQRDQSGPWVFPSRYNTTRHGAAGDGRTKSIKDARYKLRRLSGIDDWSAHDLRRTGRTLMSRLQIKHHIRERVINHTQGGIAGVYDQHDYLQEKTDALNKLAREIYRILGKETETGKVVKLQGVG